MICALTPEQIGPVLAALACQGMLAHRVPDEVSLTALTRFCVRVAESEGGRCFGLIDSSGMPRGIFVGILTPDPMSDQSIGVEFLWWVAVKWRGRGSLKLLEAFERECRKSGCRRVMLGASQYVDPERRRKLYSRLGYQEHSFVMSKAL